MSTSGTTEAGGATGAVGRVSVRGGAGTGGGGRAEPDPRVLAVWSPDWPVTAAARAAHVPADRPAAVLHANRVLACSATARRHGVRRGLRRREAQARCPDLVVLAPDQGRDARLFEPVVAAVEALAPGVEVVRPGLLVLPARGPVGWFGGERAAVERLIDQVALHAGTECQIGVADGMFAAELAARRGRGVPPGRSAEFLAPLEVAELDRDPDVDRQSSLSHCTTVRSAIRAHSTGTTSDTGRSQMTTLPRLRPRKFYGSCPRDESGMLNVTCSEGLWARYRSVALGSAALLVRGRLERSPEGVLNLLADRLQRMPLAVKVASRDFR